MTGSTGPSADTATQDPSRAQGTTRVALLDGFHVEAEGREVDLPLNAQRLLARIAVTGSLPRTGVAGTLWPDATEQHAQGSLRSTLWRLEKACPGLVQATHHTLGLARATRVDVGELRAWSREVLEPQRGATTPATPTAALAHELLPGWDDDWVLIEREHLRQVQLHTLEVVADRLVADGKYAQALEAAFAAVRAEPLRESARRAVVRVHLAEGNAVEAVREFTVFRRLLADELGIAPTELMTALVRALVSD